MQQMNKPKWAKHIWAWDPTATLSPLLALSPSPSSSKVIALVIGGRRLRTQVGGRPPLAPTIESCNQRARALCVHANEHELSMSSLISSALSISPRYRPGVSWSDHQVKPPNWDRFTMSSYVYISSSSTKSIGSPPHRPRIITSTSSLSSSLIIFTINLLVIWSSVEDSKNKQLFGDKDD